MTCCAGGELYRCLLVAGAGRGAVRKHRLLRHIGLCDGDNVVLCRAILSPDGEFFLTAGADAAHDIAGIPLFAGGCIVIALFLCKRHAGVVNFHEYIGSRADLAEECGVDVVLERDCPRRGGLSFGQLTSGERLAIVDQFDACDRLFGAELLLLLLDLDGVLICHVAIFGSDNKGHRRIQRHVAGFARGGPDIRCTFLLYSRVL